MRSLELFDLTGKVAVVTGAARGLGRQHALALAEAGADVAICDLLEDEGRRTCQEIEALGKRAFFARVDVTHPPEIDQFIEDVVAALSKIDILVNNAARLRKAFPSRKWKILCGARSLTPTCPACSTLASGWRST